MSIPSQSPSFPGPPRDITYSSPSFPRCHLFQILTLHVRQFFPSRHISTSTPTSCSFIYCPIKAEKSDFAPFMSHKVNLIMTDKPRRVQMMYLYPGKGIVMKFKVKVLCINQCCQPLQSMKWARNPCPISQWVSSIPWGS